MDSQTMCHRPARRLGQHQGSTLMYHVVLRGALLMLLGILASAHAFANATVLEVFVRDGCPHCSAAKAHLAELSTQHPELEIRLREVDRDPAARADLLRLSRDAGVWPPAVPTFVIADQMYYLFRRARAEQPQAHKTTWRHAEANQRCGDAPAGRRHAATAAIAAVADCQG